VQAPYHDCLVRLSEAAIPTTLGNAKVVGTNASKS